MRYYMLNKPGGVVTATSDKFSKTVMDLFPDNIRQGLFPIGRLDRDTEGLLIITDDGDFAFRMLRPEFGITKRYFFRAFGEINEEKIKKTRERRRPLRKRRSRKAGFSFGYCFEHR